MSRRLLSCIVAVLALAAQPATGASAEPLEFRAGNPQMAAMLARLSATREMVAEAFSVAMVDLNGDGHNEIIVRSDGRGFCGSGGCLTVVLEQQGPKMVTLLSQNLFPGLGVTQEKVGAYRALAALDPGGTIIVGDRPGTPLFGKPLVYPMQAAAAAATPTADTVPAEAKATAVARSAQAGDRPQPDVVGLRLGMSLAEAKSALDAHQPKLKLQQRQTMVNDAPSTEYLSVLAATTGRRYPGGPEDAISIDFAPPPAPHRAIFIERFTAFPEGKQPLYSAVRTALIEKFGPPTHVQEGRDTYLVWAYDRSGNRIVGVNSMRCSKYAPGDPSRRDFTVLFAQIKATGCGLTVFAKLGQAQLRGAPGIQLTELADYLSVSVVDDSGFDALREAAARLAADETRRKGAAVRGPKL